MRLEVIAGSFAAAGQKGRRLTPMWALSGADAMIELQAVQDLIPL